MTSIPLTPLASKEQWQTPPSSLDGVPWQLEEELRVYGSRLIQEISMSLTISQRSSSIAQILFQRFWFVSSFKSFTILPIVQACILLSSKLDEQPIRTRDLITVTDYIVTRDLFTATHNPSPRQRHFFSLKRRKYNHQPNPPSTQDQFHWSAPKYQQGSYLKMKEDVIIGEMQVLKRLGFRTETDLPYNLLATYLQLLGLTDQTTYPGIAQMVWNIVNDAYVECFSTCMQTPVYCLFPSHAIACAAIYFVTLYPTGYSNSDQQDSSSTPIEPKIALPYDPAPWFELLDVDEGQVRCISSHLLHLYNTTSLPIPEFAFEIKQLEPQGVVSAYTSETESETSPPPKLTQEQEDHNLDQWCSSQAGLSARVRDQWGGMSFFVQDKQKIIEYVDLLTSLPTKDHING